ncbi:MAG: hypothetical protein ABIW33_08115 [Sphingomicrobium sp.]
MASNAKPAGSGARVPWRLIGWGAASALLLTPAIAMQFTREVNWSLLDFVVAGVIFAIVGGTFELAVRANGDRNYRAAVALALAGGFFTVWINLAVGIVGNEKNPVNLVFFAVILVAVAGSIAGRFRSGAMARAMAITGTLQAMVGLAVFATGLGRGERPGEAGLLMLILGLSAFWIGSALLFRQSANHL